MEGPETCISGCISGLSPQLLEAVDMVRACADDFATVFREFKPPRPLCVLFGRPSARWGRGARRTRLWSFHSMRLLPMALVDVCSAIATGLIGMVGIWVLGGTSALGWPDAPVFVTGLGARQSRRALSGSLRYRVAELPSCVVASLYVQWVFPHMLTVPPRLELEDLDCREVGRLWRLLGNALGRRAHLCWTAIGAPEMGSMVTQCLAAMLREAERTLPEHAELARRLRN